MADVEGRRLGREDDPEAASARLGERLRTGRLAPDDLSLLAFLEAPGARELAAQLDPALVPRRAWPAELDELAVLSSAPTPGRFCFGAWPARLTFVTARLLGQAAPADSPALARAEGFPDAIPEWLVAEALQETVAGALSSDFLAALVMLRDAPGWAARGGEAPLELQAYPHLCRLLGRDVVEARVRALLFTALL